MNTGALSGLGKDISNFGKGFEGRALGARRRSVTGWVISSTRVGHLTSHFAGFRETIVSYNTMRGCCVSIVFKNMAAILESGALDPTCFVLPDSSVLHYSVEGNTSPGSPVIVFINDIFTNFHIWDPTIDRLKKYCPQYRLVRYGEFALA